MKLKIAFSMLAPVLLLTSPANAATRHYDCSKAGNANKAACKTASSATASKTSKTTKTTKADKPAATTAKVAIAKHATKPASTPARAKPALAIAAATARKAPAKKIPAKAAAQVSSVDSRDPKGATARCKDGMYSHSKTRTGACSRHGGVSSWL